MKKIAYKFLAFGILLGMTLGACSPSVSMGMAKSNQVRETNPTVAVDDIASVVDGNNAFALDIYSSLRSQNGNLILSPYSISLALAMTYAGAQGQTESQMAQALHFTGQDKLHPAFNALDLALEQAPQIVDKDQEPMQLSIANAVWAEQTYAFQQDFLDVISLNYGAGVHLADFINQAEPARKEINNWVSDQTKKKINDLLPKNSVDADTRMVLVNAIYFKADWLDQFKSNSTGDDNFHLLNGTDVTAKIMHADLFGIPYAQGDGYQAAELAYAGNTSAMDIIVPDAGKYEAFESTFDSAMLNEILNGMQPASVSLGLPKFKFTSEFSLPNTLQNLGMTDAFDGDLADFSGMTGNKELYIGNIIHKAFVAVDEKGTEAAAATVVIMQTAGAIQMNVNLQVDRPFIFIIRDTVHGQILFMGRVLNPAE